MAWPGRRSGEALAWPAPMPFSKFDPHRPPDPGEDPMQPATPAAGRRARLLRWGTWITLAMTALGYGFIAYWLFRGA